MSTADTASLANLSLLSGSTVVASAPPPGNPSGAFSLPNYASFPPFYTLQPNLTTRARQFELWSALITSYCAHHRLFKLSISAPPPNLFNNPTIHRSLKPNDIRAVLNHMSQPENGPLIEWITPAVRGETSNTCYVYWKSLTDWADRIYQWIDETGQKGAVLTIYELREGEAVVKADWEGIDEGLLRKILNVLVKRGKCQIFGEEESAGVKFF